MAVEIRCDECKAYMSTGDNVVCDDCVESLKEEINGLKSELDDTQSQLDDANLEIEKLNKELENV